MSIILENVFFGIACWLWEIFKVYGQTINSIILFLTLLVVIWYTWETSRLRKSNEGGSTAKNVKVKFQPELDFGDPVFAKYFLNNAISKNGVDIQSKNKFVIKVGHTPTASPLYKANKIPTTYKVNLSYTSIKSPEKLNSITLDLTIDQFFYRIKY